MWSVSDSTIKVQKLAQRSRLELKHLICECFHATNFNKTNYDNKISCIQLVSTFIRPKYVRSYPIGLSIFDI